ncbi:MAG: NUDIX domain-containing protein [Ardenticatenaceae bacterium]|nr:NUDIX domain-containing protein [Anaerolineales bacterium]MCB8920362.1 NUDIX domain-containing protein [Ardenticatenaceae bacterium]MCB8989317.1 NUDIX domain-containing protein [Ardenticatenaceae bacterium]
MQMAIRLTVPRQRIGVCVVIFDEQQRVLLLRHVFHPYYPWGLPGGWLGRDEDPAAGALREVREETGLTAVLGSVLQITHDSSPPHLTVAFLAELQPGSMTLSSEIIEARWFAMDDLPGLYPFMISAVETAVAVQTTHSPSQTPHSAQATINTALAEEKIDTHEKK